MNDRELIDLVIDFARRINELDIKYYPLYQKSEDVSAVIAAFEAEIKKVYSQYLTERKRTYYTCISSTPRFSAVGRTALSTVQRTKNRATVVFYATQGLSDYQFILVCKNGRWLINSFKQRYHSEDRSETYQWQYGSF